MSDKMHDLSISGMLRTQREEYQTRIRELEAELEEVKVTAHERGYYQGKAAGDAFGAAMREHVTRLEAEMMVLEAERNQAIEAKRVSEAKRDKERFIYMLVFNGEAQALSKSFRALLAALETAKAERDVLRGSLKDALDKILTLYAWSDQVGLYDIEETPAVVKARAALAETENQHEPD